MSNDYTDDLKWDAKAIMDKAARPDTQGRTPAEKLKNAFVATVGLNVAIRVTENLIDGFRKEGVLDPSGVQEDERGFLAKRMEVLDTTLEPLTVYTGHDWLGNVLGNVDPMSDEALSVLARGAGNLTAQGYQEQLVKTYGTLEAALCSVQETQKTAENPVPIKDPTVFVKDVVEAASGLLDEQTLQDYAEVGLFDDILLMAGEDVTPENLKILEEYLSDFLSKQDEATPEAQKTAENPVQVKVEPTEDGEDGEEDTIKTTQQAIAFAREVMKDPDIAEKLGVSRGTVANMAQGKAKKPITEQGAKRLRAHLHMLERKMAQSIGVLWPVIH